MSQREKKKIRLGDRLRNVSTINNEFQLVTLMMVPENQTRPDLEVCGAPVATGDLKLTVPSKC